MNHSSSLKKILWMNKLVEIELTDINQEDSAEFQKVLKQIILYCSPELSLVLEKGHLKKFKLSKCPWISQHTRV